MENVKDLLIRVCTPTIDVWQASISLRYVSIQTHSGFQSTKSVRSTLSITAAYPCKCYTEATVYNAHSANRHLHGSGQR